MRMRTLVSNVEFGERRLDFVELLVLSLICRERLSFFQVDLIAE